MVALHPHYSFSYAPGVVLSVQSESDITVRLYDGAETQLPRDEVGPRHRCDCRRVVQARNMHTVPCREKRYRRAGLPLDRCAEDPVVSLLFPQILSDHECAVLLWGLFLIICFTRQVFFVHRDKFALDVQYIVLCEDQWVGKAVVFRNAHTGTYQLGVYPACRLVHLEPLQTCVCREWRESQRQFMLVTSGAVKERVGTGREYEIEGSDGRRQRQASVHVFGAFTKRHPLAPGDHVLCAADPHHLHYLPGVVTAAARGQVSVSLCDET